MSIFIQEVLGLLNRNQKKITLDKTKDWFQFGKLYQSSSLNNKSGYAPKMDPFVIKWGDFIGQATEDLTRTLPGQGNLGYIPVYTDPSGTCNWDTLKDSIITQNSLNTIINIAGDLTVTGTSNLNGNINLGNNIGDIIRLYGTLYDNAGNGPLPNQVLVGQTGGVALWQNDDVVETLTLGAIWVGNTSNLKQELPIGLVNKVLISNGTTLTYGSSVILAPIGSVPNANAATFIGNTLNLEPASESFGGIVTTTTQSFDGNKTFIKDILVNSITVGRGAGGISSNTAFGINSLQVNTGYNNTAIGKDSLKINLEGYDNTALGINSLLSNTSGYQNTALGVAGLNSNSTGANNTAVGYATMYYNTSGNSNTALGHRSLRDNTTGSNNTAVGYGAGKDIIDLNNTTSIGNAATCIASNQVTIGNDSVTSTVLKGLVTAPSTTNALITADTTGKSLVTKEYVNANTRPYKVYTALLTQTGTSAPTAIVLENTLGVTPTLGYDGVGQYSINATGAFTIDKTWIIFNSVNYNAQTISNNIKVLNGIIILTRSMTGTSIDNVLNSTEIEIRVYN